MTTTLYILFSALAILFPLTIFILVKQFLAIRKKEDKFQKSVNRRGDCVSFKYNAKGSNLPQSDIYEAKKSRITPILPLNKSEKKVFELNQEYNAISTY